MEEDFTNGQLFDVEGNLFDFDSISFDGELSDIDSVPNSVSYVDSLYSSDPAAAFRNAFVSRVYDTSQIAKYEATMNYLKCLCPGRSEKDIYNQLLLVKKYWSRSEKINRQGQRLRTHTKVEGDVDLALKKMVKEVSSCNRMKEATVMRQIKFFVFINYGLKTIQDYWIGCTDIVWKDEYCRMLLEIVVGQRSLNKMLVALFCASLAVEKPTDYCRLLVDAMESLPIDMDFHCSILAENGDADVEVAEQAALALLEGEEGAIECCNEDVLIRLSLMKWMVALELQRRAQKSCRKKR